MRTTEKMLQNQVDYLNELMGTPKKPWTSENGKTRSNIGNYHLYFAYGGVCLHQIMNEGGGVKTPIGGGCVPKKELYQKLTAFIEGIELGIMSTLKTEK